MLEDLVHRRTCIEMQELLSGVRRFAPLNMPELPVRYFCKSRVLQRLGVSRESSLTTNAFLVSMQEGPATTQSQAHEVW
jgi:hypothetical protein